MLISAPSKTTHQGHRKTTSSLLPIARVRQPLQKRFLDENVKRKTVASARGDFGGPLFVRERRNIILQRSDDRINFCREKLLFQTKI